MYKPKVIKCRLKTGGKTIEEIREQYKGQGLTYRDFENAQRANEQFDGLVLLLSLWAYDEYGSYHVYGWENDDGNVLCRANTPFPAIQRQA